MQEGWRWRTDRKRERKRKKEVKMRERETKKDTGQSTNREGILGREI